MFGLFKKKEEKTETVSDSREEYKKRFPKLQVEYQPEELTILAVTGANGFGGGKTRGEKLWTASVGLTAWMEEDSPDIHRGEFVLSTIADDKLLEHLQRRVRPDFIIKFKGRVAEDGRRLLLLDLPEPGFDPDLKAILEEQKKPVTFWVEGLGTFALNRQVNWFETELDWLGTEVSLSFDRMDEAEMKQSQNTAKALLAGAADWDRRVREYAADELLELANDWSQDMDEDGGAVEVTREQFMERMELEAVQVEPDGSFEFWFGDGWLFAGHSIRVTGSLENGPDEASMEG